MIGENEDDLKISDKLAYGRTSLALERTLMAAIRTSVAMISFGFTIAKFFQDLKEIEPLKGHISISSRNVGFWLVVVGTLYILASSIQYILIMKSLRIEGSRKRIPFTLILAIVITVLGFALTISFYTDFLSLGLDH